MNETYDEDLIGKICLALFKIHCEKAICYKLNDEAEMKRSLINTMGNSTSNIQEVQNHVCQSQLDHYEKSEINVRMKAPELIGRLTCVLWIYCNGMNNFTY